MIYTSYFARLKDLPDDIIPISICAKAPDWYKGLEYKKLAPIYEHFIRWKCDGDNWRFAENYKSRVLGKLDAYEVLSDLSSMVYSFNVGEDDICLVCYEKSTDFCHRHYVREWLNANGIKCEEWR